MPTGKRRDAIRPADLPDLAFADPARARSHSLRLLDGDPDPLSTTYALHALGVVERDSGNTGRATSLFRQGAALAKRSGLPGRWTDLMASLGTALAMEGRQRAALDAFDVVMASVDDGALPRVLVRRSAVYNLGGHADLGYKDAIRAAELFAVAGDTSWEAFARSNAAVAEMSRGRYGQAVDLLDRAQQIFEAAGDNFQVTGALLNRAHCSLVLGDLPHALKLLYEARERFDDLGVTPPDVLRDTIVAQLAAGLADDAALTARALARALEIDPSESLRRTDGYVAAALAHLAAGELDPATDFARRAVRAGRRQENADVERYARVVLLRAQFASGRITKRHARAAAELATATRDRFSSERLDALVLAGRMAIATGLDDLASTALTEAATYRRKGPALRRATAWYAKGLLARLQGDRGGVLRACERGLDILDTHALSLGATELRARSTVHGSDLAILAGRQVIEDGSARDILRWTERWRASVLSLPWPERTDDPVLTAELGKLRAVERDLGAAPDAKQEAERRRIEERIRRHVHARTGDATARRRRFDVRELLDAIGDHTTVVSIVGVVGGGFHVCVAREGRVRRVVGGSIDGIDQAIEFARFALRGAALSPDVAAGPLLRGLEPALERLEVTMMGDAGRLLGDGPVVLIPPATLQAAPWGALPSLRDRAFTVAPSAAAWLRARAMTEPEHRRTALVGGPNLTTSAREVKLLAGAYDDVTVLEGESATTENALAAIDGAWLAHVGAHGRFRGDNPMFSAVELADGPLTVFDFEGLRRAPYRLLLTACESGVTSRAGAEELLGLTTSLSGLGTASVMASVVPVSDEGSVDLSLIVHERLRAGDDLAGALREARRRADDPVGRATAWAFLPLGAA